MKELSLNILDITKNSVSAGAKNIEVSLVKDGDGILTLKIKDDGCGMSPEILANVTNPFYTTRTTRKVGMGLPLLKLAAEQTGGHLSIASTTDEQEHGTTLMAAFDTKSIDFMPIGDIISTMCILIAGSPDIDFCFKDISAEHNVILDTKELREVLGDVSLAEPEVGEWMREYLKEQYANE